MGKSSSDGGFSIAMFDYQRVVCFPHVFLTVQRNIYKPVTVIPAALPQGLTQLQHVFLHKNQLFPLSHGCNSWFVPV
jgi:hypothetical protein